MSMLIMVGEEDEFQDLTITELLKALIHRRTGGRLRYLRVDEIGDQVCVSAVAPSYHVRQLAEQSVLPFVARDRLQLEIDVFPTTDWREPDSEHRTELATEKADSSQTLRR